LVDFWTKSPPNLKIWPVLVTFFKRSAKKFENPPLKIENFAGFFKIIQISKNFAGFGQFF